MIGSSACSDLFVKTISTRRLWMHFDYSDVGDFIMVSNLRCWWQNHYVGDFFIVLVIFNVGHQHHKPTHFVVQHRCGHTLTNFYSDTFLIIPICQKSMPSLAPPSHCVWVYYWILNVKRAPEMASIFGICGLNLMSVSQFRKMRLSTKYDFGDSDVGDIVMLVTLWWWLI